MVIDVLAITEFSATPSEAAAIVELATSEISYDFIRFSYECIRLSYDFIFLYIYIWFWEFFV